MLLLIQDPVESFEFPARDDRLLIAASPVEGLLKALSQDPDLILVAGARASLVAELKGRASLEEIPLLVVTGSADAHIRVELLQAGAQDVISPDCPEEFAMKVDSLVRSRRAKRRSERDLQALIYAVSHDLQAPLRAISGFGGALLSEYGEMVAPEARHLMDRVSVNARRMTAMLDGLLELSRLFRESTPRRTVDLSALAVELAEEFRAQEPGREVEMVIASGMSVLAEPRLVRILYEKLLDNAWKFTAPKNDARVEIGQDQQGFYVRDNGVGFDMQYSEKLFTPFQRLHGPEFQGIGMGLAIAARIVGQRGGWIRAEAAPGRGATFYFSLDGPG